jgi:PAS domain S-box-containing protein
MADDVTNEPDLSGQVQVEQVRVLHLEDNALDGDLICEFLRAENLNCDVHRVWTRQSFEAALADETWDLILADHQLPSFDGEAALSIAHRTVPNVPFVFVSGTLGEEVAVEALKRGATDYVVKQRIERLPGVVRRALAESAERAERRRAEAALRQSQENFAVLVNAMPLLCWMADPDGSITWFNQQWYDYTGTTPAEMQGWGWKAVHDPVLAPQVIERWKSSVASGQPFEMIFPLRGSDGRFRTFLTRALPVQDEAGQVVRWFGTNTDISAQQDAEEALRRLNETLEQRVVQAIAEREAIIAKLHEAQRLETIGQLTGGVAHDFNNLLTPIVASLDLLRRRSDADDRSQRLIAGALQAAERAKTLVQRLLAFARRQVLEPRAVDVASLVEGMSELISRSIGPQIALQVQAEPDLLAARVDPNQLELALLNLAVNARDAMSGGGALTIKVDQCIVSAGDPRPLRHGEYIRLSVSDTGIGMDAATLRRAIEPFYSTKGVGKGTGLGLSMVHGLAAQSGGALILSSQPGQGTCAEMWLPVASESARDGGGDARGSLRPSQPLTILLVDDEAIVRAATVEMLTDLGHHVVEAGSAAHALELLRGGGTSPDLVITDYLMPVMNGAELAAEIRARDPNMPILLATGYASLAGNTMADLPLLPKPFRQSELAATMERLLAAAQQAGPRKPPHLQVVR